MTGQHRAGLREPINWQREADHDGLTSGILLMHWKSLRSLTGKKVVEPTERIFLRKGSDGWGETDRREGNRSVNLFYTDTSSMDKHSSYRQTSLLDATDAKTVEPSYNQTPQWLKKAFSCWRLRGMSVCCHGSGPGEPDSERQRASWWSNDLLKWILDKECSNRLMLASSAHTWKVQ